MLNCAHLEGQRTGTAPRRSSFARYAIYYTPQPGTALAAFGRSWFGRANDGATLQAFSDAGLAGTSFAKIAAAPGRYTGLHALFRAPFALRDGVGPEALKSRLINFVARRKPVETGPLTLSRAGRSLVLGPSSRRPHLSGWPLNASGHSRISPLHRRTLSARNMRVQFSATISACCWRASVIPTC
jgi:hypothetical protein